MKICTPFAGMARFLVADGDEVDTGSAVLAAGGDELLVIEAVRGEDS